MPMGGEGFGEFGGISVEVVGMATASEWLEDKGSSTCWISGGNCGSGDIAEDWWV